MIVARAVAPTAESSGIPFETARDYLLSLPSLPEDVASQLRRFPAMEDAPAALPAGEVTSEKADVGGAQATVLTAGTARWRASSGCATASSTRWPAR
jgi:hypothetical protein